MSDTKGIQFSLGGKFQFQVTKVVSDEVERFSVEFGDKYNANIVIANGVTWVEASQAMNRFKDEFEDAFQVLVEISTLTPAGVHEEG